MRSFLKEKGTHVDDMTHPTSAATKRRFVALCLGLLAALVLNITVVAGVVAPRASAAFWPAGIDVWVESNGMGPIKSRVFRAHDHNTKRVAYVLDGLRARSDLSGWEIETNVAQMLAARNINVVMPVGGMSSFYTDWIQPSSFVPTGSASGSASGSAYPGRAVWETFLTHELPAALHARFGFASTRNAIFGISMSGGSAITLATYHPQQFSYAGSLSGFLDTSEPFMPIAMRIAMIDAGNYNMDDMWGPPRNPLWLRNDPTWFAPSIPASHVRLFVSSGNGNPSGWDGPLGPFNIFNAEQLERIALQNTQQFQNKLDSIGFHNVLYYYPPVGIHTWADWMDAVNVMLPDLSAHIG